jgi:hypothetical protein
MVRILNFNLNKKDNSMFKGVDTHRGGDVFVGVGAGNSGWEQCGAFKCRAARSGSGVVDQVEHPSHSKISGHYL